VSWALPTRKVLLEAAADEDEDGCPDFVLEPGFSPVAGRMHAPLDLDDFGHADVVVRHECPDQPTASLGSVHGCVAEVPFATCVHEREISIPGM
jgi:hypothetical protein